MIRSVVRTPLVLKSTAALVQCSAKPAAAALLFRQPATRVSNIFNYSSPTANLINQYQRQQHRFYSAITTDEPAKVLSFADVKQLVTAATAAPPAGSEPVDVTKPIIVDVREPSEYAEGHIPTAVNIPYKSSPGALSLEPEDFEDAFGFPKPSTDRELIFYCLAGVRSSAAEELACTFGYQK